MRTILTIAEQEQFLSDNFQYRTLKHVWSCRGLGNSKILDARDNVIGKAGGCGYCRYGAALGNAITEMLGVQVHKLAKRVCKGKRGQGKRSKDFYGLYVNRDGKAYLDGACGEQSMETVLNKIGFSLQYVGETGKMSNKGTVFYSLKPLSKHERKYLR